jgi:hypothetical protein
MNKTSKFYLLFAAIRSFFCLGIATYDVMHGRPAAILWATGSILLILLPILSYVHDNNSLLNDIKDKLDKE